MRKFLPFFLSFLLISCSQDDLSPVLEEVDNTLLSVSVQDENSVTITDLDNLVKGYNPSKSRSNSYTISTITDKNGNPAIYVLNLDKGGWILVSATRKYQPVIARNDEGSFNINDIMPEGLEMWRDNMIALISDVDNSIPQDTIKLYQRQWASISPSIALKSAPARPSSRVDHWTDEPVFHSDFTKEDYERLQGSMADTIAELRGRGYTVETFEHLSYGELIPGYYGQQGITINDLIQMCDGMTYIFYSENFRFLSFAAYITTYSEDKTEPYIKSTWDQSQGYNSTFPTKDGKRCVVGCVPVAVGQLMRHFQHPTNYKNFQWSAMPLTYPTATTSDFLYDIGQAMNITLGTSISEANFDDARDFLKKYYNFTVKKGLSNPQVENIINGQLVYLSAKFGDSGRHSWLSGGRWINSSIEKCEIYTFTLPDEMTTCGNMQVETILPSTRTFYMNWGWGGRYDGYFSPSGWYIPNESSMSSDIRVMYGISKK